MIQYTFASSTTKPVIEIDPAARVKQVTIWGAFGSTVTVEASVNDLPSFEPVIDRQTALQLKVDTSKKTFTIIDNKINKLRLTATPTGTWYVGIETWG